MSQFQSIPFATLFRPLKPSTSKRAHTRVQRGPSIESVLVPPPTTQLEPLSSMSIPSIASPPLALPPTPPPPMPILAQVPLNPTRTGTLIRSLRGIPGVLLD
ncbi:hypothetical protein OPQ81_008707 [Rhizoctonia solani]|nr:hypothetical protein OPQ81_008707 [Rhizoctonia solani]